MGPVATTDYARLTRSSRDDSPLRRHQVRDSDQSPIHHPAGGTAAYQIVTDRVIFRVTGADTGGAYSVIEGWILPGGGPPALHTHPWAETFCILEGEFEIRGRRGSEPWAVRVGPGETVHVPGGAPHTFKVVSATPGRALNTFAPAGIEAFFAELGTPVDPAAPLAFGPLPDFATLEAIHHKHGVVFLEPLPTPTGVSHV
jgi:quercetin dioxygenase-like cupin family protein